MDEIKVLKAMVGQGNNFNGWNWTIDKCRIDAIKWAIARIEELGPRIKFADLLLDKPEDRVFHASDETWWHNPGGYRLVSADEPKYVTEMRTKINELETRNKDLEAYIQGNGTVVIGNTVYYLTTSEAKNPTINIPWPVCGLRYWDRPDRWHEFGGW